MANEITIIDDQGVERFLGNNLPDGPLKYQWRTYEEVHDVPLIKREDWKPVDLSYYTPPIKNQDSIRACNSFDTVSVFEACRALAGLPYVQLSCGYLYGAINGQEDQGSMLEDALDWMLKNGTCPTDVVGDLDWKQGSWPADVAEKAKPYRFLEAYWCPTFGHCGSALMRGFLVSVGILWYPNYKVDGDGWLPNRGSGRPGGHALMRDGLAYRNGKWGLPGPNSWSPDWGADGRCVIPEECFGDQVGGFWALRSVISESTDIPSPRM